MKPIRKRKAILILFLVILLVRVPVYAATLSINEEGTTLGQTTVTARVEAPGESDEPENSEVDDGEIKTGDKTKVLCYLCIALLSGLVITGILWKKSIENEKEK